MNQFVLQRMAGVQNQLMAIHQSGAGLSNASIGTERSTFINDFLEKVLPPIYRFGNGDATDRNGRRSGQLDIVIEYPFSPSLPITSQGQTRLYLAESIAAVIEVKSNLASQWDQAVSTAEQLYPLERNFGSTISFGCSPERKIPLFVVGYTGWSSSDSLKEHLDACPKISGALIIDNGIYLSQRVKAHGPIALWGLICELHMYTTSLQSASTSPSDYVI